MTDLITYKPIGKVKSIYKQPAGTPIQPNNGVQPGEIEIYPEFQDGLMDLDGFSHVILLYHFHLLKNTSLKVIPFMDTTEHGIFATRSPARPNKIGLPVLKIVKIEHNIITVEGIDIVNNTPVLDIKPYVPQFDTPELSEIGWLENNYMKQKDMKDDERFL